MNLLDKIQERGLHLTFAATFFSFLSFILVVLWFVCPWREESRIGDKNCLTVGYWQKLMGFCGIESMLPRNV